MNPKLRSFDYQTLSQRSMRRIKYEQARTKFVRACDGLISTTLVLSR